VAEIYDRRGRGGTGSLLIVSALVVSVLLADGLVYFRRMDRTFAFVV